MKIEIGKRYKNARRETDGITIIHQDGTSELCFIGITDSGHIVRIDSRGKSKWFECGGCWYQLDLENPTEPLWALVKLEQK